MKTHFLFFFYFFFIFFIRDEYRVIRMKSRKMKTIMLFDDVYIRPQLLYKNFTFCQTTIF